MIFAALQHLLRPINARRGDKRMLPMDEKLERAQLMARFKLMVKRSLGESVDLERLARDLAYARSRLAEVRRLRRTKNC